MPRFSSVSSGTVLANQNSLVASTLPKLSREIADNVFSDLPFFFWMRNKGKVKAWDTGESYEVSLMYGENEYARAYEDYELLDTGPPSGFGNAIYMRAKYRVPIMYAATTLSANSGRAQIYNLIEKLKMQATKSLEKTINTDLFRSGNLTDTRKITSMAYMMQKLASGSQTAIIGGIDKSSTSPDYSWWEHQYHAGITSSLLNSNLLKYIRSQVIDCTDGNDGPDLGLCDAGTYQEIENATYDKRRFVNSDAANFGFDNLVYNGVTYMYDKSISDEDANAYGEGTLYHVNSDHLNIAVCTDRNFQVVPPEYDVNQDVYLGAVLTHMQLICDNMSRQGVMDGTYTG